MVQNKALFKKLPYDPDKDFALVAWFNTGHLPTMVNKDIPVRNVPEFAAWAQGRKVSLATYGIGSFAHIVTETLNRHYGLKMEAVHYRGESAMWQDVASGSVQGATGSYASGTAVLQAGSEMPRPAARHSISMRQPWPAPWAPPITASSSGTTTSLPLVGQL